MEAQNESNGAESRKPRHMRTDPLGHSTIPFSRDLGKVDGQSPDFFRSILGTRRKTALEERIGQFTPHLLPGFVADT